jgi:hypothetical protein
MCSTGVCFALFGVGVGVGAGVGGAVSGEEAGTTLGKGVPFLDTFVADMMLGKVNFLFHYGYFGIDDVISESNGYDVRE